MNNKSRAILVVSVLISCILWTGAALAASMPQPTFVGVGQRDGSDRIMLTFAEPLPSDLNLGEHVKANIDTLALSDWAFGPERKVAWLLGVPKDSKVKLRFVDSVIQRTVFSSEKPAEYLLSARLPTLDVAGRGPIIPLQENPSLPVQLSNVEAVQLELLKVKNPQLLANQLSPYEAPSTYLLNQLSGAVESLGVTERLPDPGTLGLPSQLGLPLALDKPGWYLAVLKPAGRFGDDSTIIRQILYTDLAIRVMRFDDGVSVSVTRFSDGSVVTDAKVTLSRFKETQSRQLSKEGSAYFNGQFLNPALVTVSTADDESYMPLSASPLDLDGFPVAGAPARDIEVFATANRDLVAPGASITISAIMRGHDGASVPTQPITVKWQNPLGEVLHSERQSGNDEGLWQFTHVLTTSARPGLWRAVFFTDPKGPAVGEFSFSVDNFVPERISISMPELPEHAHIDETISLPVSVQYLHGAKAAGLTVESNLGFKSAWETAVPEWKIGKRFELYASNQQLESLELDGEGKTTLTLETPSQKDITAPVETTVSVSVLDGNSRIERKRQTTLWPLQHMAGIKPAFSNDAVEYKGVAEFSVALFTLGKPSTELRQVEVNAYRDSGDGFWVFNDAEGWVYQKRFGQQPVFNEFLTIGGEPQQLSFKTDWGSYRIEVTDRESGARSDYSFYAGWWGGAQNRAFKPEGLDAQLTNLDPENLTISLNAPFDGTLHTQLITDKPLTTQTESITTGNTLLSLDVSQVSNRQDAYLLLTLTGRENELPARSLAILPLRWQRDDRRLNPSVKLPPEWRPDSRQSIQVDIPGMTGGKAFLMVADKGITNITGYEPLDPFDYAYRKRKLGATLADFHDRFYIQVSELLTLTRSGGDTVLKRNGPREEATERLTLLHTSKPVSVVNGKASFELDLPRYTGEAMITVVVVDGNRFGQSVLSQRIVSPITIEWRAPQAMVYGDQLNSSVLLRNNQTVPKTINLSALNDPSLTIELSQSVITLAPDEQKRIPFTIAIDSTAAEVGAIDVVLLADTDDDSFELAQEIFLRAPGGEITEDEFLVIAANTEVVFDNEVTQDWLGFEQELLVSTGLPLDVKEHYQRLVRFAYSCSEQTVSQVMSLVLGNPDIDALVDQQEADVILDSAVSRLYRRQLSGGGISLWDNGEMGPWISVYIADFLQRLSKLRQEPTLDERLSRLLAQVHQFVAQPGQLNINTRAAVVSYAALVSARAGKLDLSTLNRATESIVEVTTATADAQLAHAFFLLGDTQRSEALLDNALMKKRKRGWYADYGSELSDASQLLITMGEMRDSGWRTQSQMITKANERIRRALNTKRWYSTQERLRLVQAATLWSPSGTATVNTNGETRQFTGSLYLSGTQFQSLENIGDTPLYATRRVSGYRKQDIPVTHEELTIKQSYFNTDGSPASLADVEVGDLIIVSNHLDNSGLAIENALYVDALPAGFVIENPGLGQGISLDGWQDHEIHAHGKAKLDYERFEVKRYSAVLALRGSTTLVYQMRAVAAGKMADPGASLEDFYSPQIRTATGSSGQITIQAKK